MFKPESWSIERIAVLLTPTVFAPAAAMFTGWLAAHFPGLPRPPASLVVGIEIAAVVGTVSLVLKWLHGRQKLIGLPLPHLTPEQLTQLEAEIERIIAESSDPPVGPSPGQVRALVRTEIRELLGRNAETAPTQ